MGVDERAAAVGLSDKARQALAALKLKDREVGVQEGDAAGDGPSSTLICRIPNVMTP